MTIVTSIIGLLYVIVALTYPAAIIFLLLWIKQIKENTKTQVEQNNLLIELLNKTKGQ